MYARTFASTHVYVRSRLFTNALNLISHVCMAVLAMASKEKLLQYNKLL